MLTAGVLRCRKGNPHLEGDLKRVSMRRARAIVVLSTCDAADQVPTPAALELHRKQGSDRTLAHAASVTGNDSCAALRPCSTGCSVSAMG